VWYLILTSSTVLGRIRWLWVAPGASQCWKLSVAGGGWDFFWWRYTEERLLSKNRANLTQWKQNITNETKLTDSISDTLPISCNAATRCAWRRAVVSTSTRWCDVTSPPTPQVKQSTRFTHISKFCLSVRELELNITGSFCRNHSARIVLYFTISTQEGATYGEWSLVRRDVLIKWESSSSYGTFLCNYRCLCIYDLCEA
jgi:hypothetical protein